MDRSEWQSKGKKARTPEQSVKRQVRRAPRSRVPAPQNMAISQEERHQMIAEAAYYRAEQRGFFGGDPLRDWLEAEAEVISRLSEVVLRVDSPGSR